MSYHMYVSCIVSTRTPPANYQQLARTIPHCNSAVATHRRAYYVRTTAAARCCICQIMCDEPPIVSRCKAGNMRLTRANEIRGGSINYFGCDSTGCSCAYKELPFTCLCRLCAQSVGKNVAVISFKDDHGQWHSVHHKFEARMLMGDDGAYPQVTEFKPRKLHPCSLVGTQWECQKSRKISKDEQICQAGPLGPVHVKCYRHVFDTEVD